MKKIRVGQDGEEGQGGQDGEEDHGGQDGEGQGGQDGHGDQGGALIKFHGQSSTSLGKGSGAKSSLTKNSPGFSANFE